MFHEYTGDLALPIFKVTQSGMIYYKTEFALKAFEKSLPWLSVVHDPITNWIFIGFGKDYRGVQIKTWPSNFTRWEYYDPNINCPERAGYCSYKNLTDLLKRVERDFPYGLF